MSSWPKTSGWVLGGVVGAGLLGMLLASLAAANDPFRPFLAGLPAIVMALAAIARHLGDRPCGAWHLLGVASLLVVTVRRDVLALEGMDAPLAAAWVCLLGAYLVGRLPALRRALGHRLPLRPPTVFFLLPLVVYLAAATWSTSVRAPDGDEPYYLLLAHSLAFDLDTDLANNYAAGDGRRFLDRDLEPQPGDPVGPGGAIYSRHNPLLPLLLAPFYALGGRAGAVLAMALIAAGLAWLTLRLAARVAPERPRGGLLAWALLAFTSPLLLYSQQIWVEVPAALALAVALDRLWAIRADGRAGLGTMLTLATALVALPLLKLRLGLLALPILVLVILAIRHRLGGRAGRRAAVSGLASLVIVVAAILLRNAQRFGNPLKMYAWDDLALFDRPLAAFATGGFGMFFDSAFGLFAFAPVWLVLLPAILIASRSALGRHRWLVRDAAVIAIPYWIAVAPRLEWYGGWSPPFRYPLALLPVLALVTVPMLGRRRVSNNALIGGLTLVTAALTVLWLAVPGWTYNLADGGNHLLDAGGMRLGADLGRFFPSMVRPRMATWVWPALSVLAVPLMLGIRRHRRRRCGTGWAWGISAVWLAAAGLLLAAHRVPTRTAELEDGFVRTHGGHLTPPIWTVARPRYRAGWTLRATSVASLPVVGNGMVDLRLAVRFVANSPDRPFALDILADDRLLLRWQATGDGVWQTIDIPNVEWPEGARLVLRGHVDQVPERPNNGVAIDYIDFGWHDR